LARYLKNCSVLAALFGVACGGRTALEIELVPPPAGAAGSGGAAYVVDWDQIVWDDPPITEAVSYLWTGSATDTWAVVADNVGSFHREHWDGARWTRTATQNDPSARFDEAQIWAAADNEAFGGSNQDVQRWFGQTWSDWAGTPACRAVGGSARDDLWCATDTDLWRFDGARWSSQTMAGIRGILARARDDVWVWGELGANHYNGVAWTHELSNLVKRMSASAANDVWAVQDGNLLHATDPGGPWTTQNPTGAQIAAVWSESATNTWIVGAGAAMRWNGSSWALMELPLTDERLLISGSSEEIWIAGTLMLIHGHPVRKYQ
jgi:hypothetical protein